MERWSPGKSAGTVQQGCPPFCKEVASLPGIALGWGHGGLWGGQASPGLGPHFKGLLWAGGWVCAGSRGRRRGDSGGHSLGDLLNFRLQQLGPGNPLGTPHSQAPPALAAMRADPYTFCPTCWPQAPAGPHQPCQASVEGLALFTAAASSSFQ